MVKIRCSTQCSSNAQIITATCAPTSRTILVCVTFCHLSRTSSDLLLLSKQLLLSFIHHELSQTFESKAMPSRFLLLLLSAATTVVRHWHLKMCVCVTKGRIKTPQLGQGHCASRQRSFLSSSLCVHVCVQRRLNFSNSHLFFWLGAMVSAQKVWRKTDRRTKKRLRSKTNGGNSSITNADKMTPPQPRADIFGDHAPYHWQDGISWFGTQLTQPSQSGPLMPSSTVF